MVVAFFCKYLKILREMLMKQERSAVQIKVLEVLRQLPQVLHNMLGGIKQYVNI